MGHVLKEEEGVSYIFGLAVVPVYYERYSLHIYYLMVVADCCKVHLTVKKETLYTRAWIFCCNVYA